MILISIVEDSVTLVTGSVTSVTLESGGINVDPEEIVGLSVLKAVVRSLGTSVLTLRTRTTVVKLKS